MSAQRVRPLEPGDAGEARSIVQRTLDGSRHVSRVRELLCEALAGTDAECVGMVLGEQDRSPLRAVVLYGPVAGASGVMKIHALVGVDRDAMAILVDTLVREHQMGARRMFVCEIADDPASADAVATLFACAFAREGRVNDFFADGVNLDLMVRRH